MGAEEDVEKMLRALTALESLERETAAAETNVFGVLRDRMSPAARYGEPILVKYRVRDYQTPQQAEENIYLREGFPTIEGRKPLLALLAIDQYTLLDLPPSDKEAGVKTGQFGGECVFLTYDRKWILTERSGAYSSAVGSSSEWEARCRVLSDRAVLERYSLEVIANGLLVATNKIWQTVSPRMDALKKRFEKTEQVSNIVAKLKGHSRETGGPEGKTVLSLLGQKITLEK